MTQLASMGGDTAADDDASTAGGPTTAPTPYELGSPPGVLAPEELRLVDAWWRAANYLSVGQIYLMANPLLREPLQAEHVKPRLLGHFGTVPGLNLVYVHANRLIRERDLDAVFVAGPGHGGPGPNACAWLEGTYSELYSHIPQDARGHGGVLPPVLLPRRRPEPLRARRRPARSTRAASSATRCCTRTGPRSTTRTSPSSAWSATARPRPARWPAAGTRTKFLDPARDGAVLPILALNEYKIANPTILARIPESELLELMRGYGYDPHVVAGDDPAHRAPGDRGDARRPAWTGSPTIQQQARARRRAGPTPARRWPMIVLRTPKGWTCPPVVDGQQVEGTFRAHQVPLPARPHRRRRTAPSSSSGCGRTGPRSCSTTTDARSPELLALAADRSTPDERQPGRQRRRAAA